MLTPPSAASPDTGSYAVAAPAAAPFTDERITWFVNRGSGIVLVGLLSLVVVVGMLSTVRTSQRRWPRFATQALHRNLSLLTIGLIVLHAEVAVLDGFVDIRWYDVVVPFTAGYRPVRLGLGALAVDLLLLAVLTSMLRHRMSHRAWRAVHLATYPAWGLAVLHGVLIGTDSGEGWSIVVTVIGVGLVAAATVLRLAAHGHERRLARATPGYQAAAPVRPGVVR